MEGQNFTVKNCMVMCCDGQHVINFKDSRAIIPVQELFKIKECWEKNIENICGTVCKKKGNCEPHIKLNAFRFFTEDIKYENIIQDAVVTKVLIKDNCKHPYCMRAWCFEMFATKWVGTDEEEHQKWTKFLF